MKPAPFDYQAPDTLREAIDLLASNPEAFVIAGGQSLMPVLAFRLATPSLLVDLRRLPKARCQERGGSVNRPRWAHG
jgi:CO/xanthine dehydrogenase FAD-binding subunit